MSYKSREKKRKAKAVIKGAGARTARGQSRRHYLSTVEAQLLL